jgi:hypothetical protein
VTTSLHVPADRLRAGLAHVADAPTDGGTVAMVVARPAPDEREVLPRGTFTPHDGLVGDDWRARGSSSTSDGSADPDAQVTLISQRWLDLVCDGDRARWPLAGDQVVVDMDLGTATLAPGDRLRLGTALVEVTAKPHTGCAKFVARYGVEAQRIVASDEGRAMRLRGIHVRVLEAGEAGPGDALSILT